MAGARVINRTRYPVHEVRELVRRGMGDLLEDDRLTVYILPIKGASREGLTRANEVRIITRIWLGIPSDFPADQVPEPGNQPYALRDWREALLHTAAHEAWHIRHGRSERRADESATRALLLGRLVGI